MHRGSLIDNCHNALGHTRSRNVPPRLTNCDKRVATSLNTVQADGASLLVRRKGRAMPAELGRGGQQAEHIDWRKSVLLNLVIQATYCLTVATCRCGVLTSDLF